MRTLEAFTARIAGVALLTAGAILSPLGGNMHPIGAGIAFFLGVLLVRFGRWDVLA